MIVGWICLKGLIGFGVRGWNFEIFMKVVWFLLWSLMVGYFMLNRGFVIGDYSRI